jgi:hypothetical protein
LENKIDFSYDHYRKIINRYKDTIIDYPDAIGAASFTLLRHDVEFDVTKAHQMAIIDAELGIKSSFLFQVRSNAYNFISKKNIHTVNQINEMGHNLGLHVYISHIDKGDWKSLYEELTFQKKIMERSLGMKIDRFSFHRPPAWVLEKEDDLIDGLFNLYGKSFFEYSLFPKAPIYLKYLADSRHRWDYGDPMCDFNYEKFHLSLHPDEWSLKHLNEAENFKLLASNHSAVFQRTLETETTNFSTVNFSYDI